MKLETIRHFADLEEVKDEWDELLERSSSKSVFLTWEWLYNWWKYFAKDKKLNILLARKTENGKLLGIAPLYIENKKKCGFDVTAVRFLGDDYVASDFLDYIVEPGCEEKFVKAIYEHFDERRRDWDVWEMKDMDEHSSSGGYLKDIAGGACRVIVTRAQVCPYLDLPENYKDLINSLSSGMRKDLQRKMKKIVSDKEYRFSVNDFQSDIKTNIDVLFGLHQARFDMKKKKTAFGGDVLRSFHYDTAEDFNSKHWLRFYFLRKNGRDAACLYSFKFKNRLCYYQSGFDPQQSGKSLGTIMFGYALQDCVETGTGQFHYLRGNEEYKKRWTSDFYNTVNIFIFSRTVKGSILYCYYKSIRFLKKLKQVFRKIP